LLPQAKPEYAGYVAWRGVLDETELPREYHDLIFNHVTFCFPTGELLLCIPIPVDDSAGAAAQQRRRCCFIWYRPADFEHELPALCTDASGKQHGITIPPPLIRPEVVGELKARAQALLPPLVADMVQRVERPLFQAIFDLESPQLVFDRVALLGDAAFVARPHVVAGVTKAALDANGLADALADEKDLTSALARYDRERRDFGSKIVAHARYLGTYLGAHTRHLATDEYPSDRRPDVMMRDYGAAHLLRR
ncbi:MAG TPA: FAD-dependent oxidoreductase, partial [Xanthobacteraceae bacterium]|nr:FAD-dependent oxidoreductase [Xanthobacteraceae bacterium]